MQSDLAKIISETKLKVTALKDKLEACDKVTIELRNRLTALEDQNKVLNLEVDEKNKNIKMLKLARNVAGGNTSD